MGIPVIAIGVPTVVDASTLVSDLNPEVEEKASESQFYKSMYVTSKDIDALIKRISYTLSEAVNICMSSVI
jgi:spore protease